MIASATLEWIKGGRKGECPNVLGSTENQNRPSERLQKIRLNSRSVVDRHFDAQMEMMK